MQLSTKTRYALRMLVDLAAHQSQGNVKITAISQRQDISLKYLEQIITILSKAGYVRGERGPLGGYCLSKDPKDITAADIVMLIEGSVSPSPCIKCGVVDCPRSDYCTTVDLWKKVDVAVMDILSKTTLQDLLDDARRKNIIDVIDSPEYFI